MNITVERYQLSLINLYGPNWDSPMFFQIIIDVRKYPMFCHNSRDWNVVQDHTFSRHSYT